MFKEADIICYLKGKMSVPASLAFEEALKMDPDFAREVEHMRKLWELAQLNTKEELAQRIKNSQSKLEDEGFFDAFK